MMTANMTIFRFATARIQSITIFRFAVIKGLRSPGTFIFNCILPLVLILIRPLWAGEFFLSGFGLLVLIIWGGAFLMSQGILTDRADGALIRILAAPVTMLRYLAQNLLAFMVPLTVQIALLTVLGIVLYDWDVSFALLFFLGYNVFTVSSVAMSFAWHCLFKKKDSSFSSFSAVITFGCFLSGAFMPVALFPTVLQYAGAVLPAWWAVRGFISLAELGAAGMDFWVGIAAMLMFTAIFLLYGGKRRMI